MFLRESCEPMSAVQGDPAFYRVGSFYSQLFSRENTQRDTTRHQIFDPVFRNRAIGVHRPRHGKHKQLCWLYRKYGGKTSTFVENLASFGSRALTLQYGAFDSARHQLSTAAQSVRNWLVDPNHRIEQEATQESLGRNREAVTEPQNLSWMGPTAIALAIVAGGLLVIGRMNQRQ